MRSDAGLLVVSVTASRPGESCVVMSLTGHAGIADCAWFRQLLELQAAPGPGRVVVDLSRLSSMDWWVALMLAWAGRVMNRRGRVLVLAAPQPAVEQVLNSAGAGQAVPGPQVRKPRVKRAVRPDSKVFLPERTGLRAIGPVLHERVYRPAGRTPAEDQTRQRRPSAPGGRGAVSIVQHHRAAAPQVPLDSGADAGGRGAGGPVAASG